MDYRAELERVLNEQLGRQAPNSSKVTVSSDGQFAIYRVGDRYQLRKLSPTARAYLQKGGDIVAVARSLFEG